MPGVTVTVRVAGVPAAVGETDNHWTPPEFGFTLAIALKASWEPLLLIVRFFCVTFSVRQYGN